MNNVDTNHNHKITPSKVICIGRNYVDHIYELGNEVPEDMVVFVKPNSAISHELHSFHQQPLHFEAELCFIMQAGRPAYVGLGLDLTKRQLQSQLKSKGLPWERAKAFDGAAVFSQFIAIDDVTSNWCFSLSIDGQMVQLGHSDQMMYSLDTIIEEVQKFMSLNDGDVIMTGTPKGVGEIKSGQTFTLSLWQNIAFVSILQLETDVTNNVPVLTHQWDAI
ncbi:fumarylacetoacetate hydrolase family protein [Shewanella gaetbuli]|uniref:Fumarylacetoacetate hydrolase family protein n=1 Tax=Shewanella gaetbuli TaxID=220752 RepID=A0A9X1ZRN0_9GAMM|nr:fumarylacetoacetate hydrolase family protein [Shewanella gaetbuli]MCL1144337.1 fumarylacetoacetate hydrolase family protein [Shewanella gaetbuli]